MSLPLRPALENVTSVDRVLEDLLVRFIINCPPEDLASVERELFHFEEASWFYIDFVKIINPTLPSLRIKSFAQNIIRLCPLVWKWDIKADEALQKFSKYKKSIPVRGAAIFNEKLNKMLLVQGTESDSWSFPRGKISKDEDDVACCIREVKEEIGFDLTDHIDENQFIERNIQGKNYKIFLVSGVPEDFPFKPQVRNEINKIEWRDFKKMSKSMFKSTVRYYLVNSMIRPLSMWLRRQKQLKGDDQLREYAEEQLKLLLGITKEEQVDPGRELLNMLHSAVQSSDDKLEASLPDQLPSMQDSQMWLPPTINPSINGPAPPPGLHPHFSQHQPPLVGFQPFAPLQFINGNFPYLDPQMMQSAMSSLPVPNMGPLPPPGGILPTPDASSLSKPVIATQQENENNNPSKLLLDILHTKRAPPITPVNEQTPGNSLTSNTLSNTSNSSDTAGNVSDSIALLNILKSSNSNRKDITGATSENGVQVKEHHVQQRYESPPQKNLILPTESISDSELNMNDESSSANDDSYENFEDSSDEEQKNYPASEDENSDDGFDYEEFESASELEQEEKVEEIQREEQPLSNKLAQAALQANRFHDGDVPHKDDRTESAKSVEGTQAPQATVKPKPKFKLLKRGENLEDVLTNIDKPSPPSTITPKKNPSALQNVAREATPNSLNLLLGTKDDDLSNSDIPSSAFIKQQSPKSEPVVTAVKQQDEKEEPQQQKEDLNPSAHLLNILKKPSVNSNETLQHKPQEDDLSSIRNHQDASSELLGILKRPMHENLSSNHYFPQPQQNSFDDPFEQTESQNSIFASNELLNILHRR